MADTLLDPDGPPSNGRWVDVCDLLGTVTIEEAEEGRRLGETIDTADDESNGFRVARFAMGNDRLTALEKAQVLKAVMLAHGVPEVSIELQPGRPNTHGMWHALFVVGEMSHHTVSRFGSNLTPVLALCKSGRSDVPGPLCNGYGGYDLCYRIITFGYANHPGAGGPLTVKAKTAGTFTIPRDSARRYVWGTEWEGGLNAADWDRKLTNPRNGKSMTMREFMGRSNAALREYHQIVAHLEHSTWAPNRKIDRLGYTAAEGEAELRRFIKEDDDMTPEELRAILRAEVPALVRKELAAAREEQTESVWAHQVPNRVLEGKTIGTGSLLSFMHEDLHGMSKGEVEPDPKA
ncbi:hypothetical protein [Nocardioides speluncae]|uniref:hypothetical protein n=1 Tax=Nocardioides speluncae TaxID=2670337 RepID=UPI000D68E34B|nr:hypothetical protein [Nocardioides speluncae]